MNANEKEKTNSTTNNRPIFWHEGLFLQPHHFQWQDLYFQSLIEPLNRFLLPAMWGAGSMTVHEDALNNGVFEIKKGEFRFPDMTHATYPGNAVVESRNFERAWKDRGHPFKVYIGVRRLTITAKNVSDPLQYESFSMLPTRFTAEPESEALPELYEGGESLSVERLRYVLKIFWETEVGAIGDYEIFPIACLETSKGNVEFSRQYIPPVINLFSSEVLTGTIKTISELMTTTVNRLEANKNDRGVHTAEFGTKDMVFILTLRTLNRFVPVLRHLMGKGASVHPWTIYGVLCQMVGELSTFSSKVNLVNIDADDSYFLYEYDHDDLGKCFLRAERILTRLMIDIAADPEYVARFDFDGQNYTLTLPDRLLQGTKRYYIVVETDLSPDQVVAELETQAKMSSTQDLPVLVAQSLPGISITHMAHPPPELPRRSVGIYFSIDHKSRLWRQVAEEKKLALYWATRPEDAKIELMVAGRET